MLTRRSTSPIEAANGDGTMYRIVDNTTSTGPGLSFTDVIIDTKCYKIWEVVLFRILDYAAGDIPDITP